MKNKKFTFKDHKADTIDTARGLSPLRVSPLPPYFEELI